MPSYPMYQPDRSFFPSDNNILPPNLNIHVGLPQSSHQPNQQNSSLSFLSSPPPNLAASQHVFHGGQGFPVINGSNAPPAFTSNVAALVARPPPPITPEIKPFQRMTTQWNAVPAFNDTRQQSSMPNVHDFKNLNFTANSCSGLNRVSLEIPNASSSKFHFENGNASQTQPQFSDSNISPWAQVLPPSTNNFHSMPANTMQSSKNSKHLNGNARQIPLQFAESSINPWAQMPPPSANNFHNISANTIQSSEHHNADVWFNARGKPDNSKPFQRENFKPRFSEMQPANINPWVANLTGNFQNNSQVEHVSSNRNWQKQNAATYNMKSRHPNEASSEFKFPNNRKNQPYWKHANFTEKNFTENESTFNSPRGSRNFHNSKNMRQERFNDNFNFKNKNNDERPKPYACDTCDRAFSTEADFQYHVSEHIKCNARNCQFEAHPKIVTLHKRMQHDTGYADAISKLKDSEEIAKWRAERKRRFPTAENIRKRKAEQAEKEARGEVIENKEFGKFKKQRFDRNGSDNKRFGADSRNRRSRHSNSRRKGNTLHNVSTITSVTVGSDTDSDDDSHIKLPRFLGISSLAETNLANISNVNHEAVAATHEVNILKEITLSSSDEADCCVKIHYDVNENKASLQSDEKIEKATEVPSSISELNNIDSDDEAPTEMPISKTPVNNTFDLSNASEKKASSVGPSEEDVSASQDNNICTVNDVDSNDDAPIEIPINKVPLSETPDFSNEIEKTSSSEIAGDRQGGKPNKRFSKKDHKELSNNRQKDADCNNTVRKSTLLEKLLADDIRHERNVIMQCIRHVVKKEFFGIGQ